MSASPSREELIELVQKLMSAEGSEAQQDAWLSLLQRSVPHPAVSDLIYHSDIQLSAEEIVDQALNYQPLRLP